MTPERFDALSRFLRAGATRRQLVRTLTGSATAILPLGWVDRTVQAKRKRRRKKRKKPPARRRITRTFSTSDPIQIPDGPNILRAPIKTG
jgi:hypothetical protein